MLKKQKIGIWEAGNLKGFAIPTPLITFSVHWQHPSCKAVYECSPFMIYNIYSPRPEPHQHIEVGSKGQLGARHTC